MNDISNLEMFFPTDICYKDYILSLKKVKATVNEKDLEKQEEFTREFGQEDQGDFIFFSFFLNKLIYHFFSLFLFDFF